VSRQPGASLPTMEDVAATAGVSRALVSLVFRESPKVSEERRARVLAAAKELGYRPNASARNLASRSSGTIGVLLNDLHNPFFAEIFDGVSDAADATGYRLLLTTSLRRDAGEDRAIETMLEHRVDGMVLLSPRLSSARLVELAMSSPIVVLGRTVARASFDTVMTDESIGSMLALQHLAELGHRRIVHIDGGRGAGATPRRAGYRRAMASLGLDAPDVVAGDFTESSGVEGARRLLRRANLPTAIFAANDLVAAGAMATLEAAGVRVPDDVSIVGYDNSMLARLEHLALTTVDQPRASMGELATRLLVERIEGRRPKPKSILAAPTLVVRRTTAAALR
jgi:DNA-binding LacI/PurR family transcriptional regulator